MPDPANNSWAAVLNQFLHAKLLEGKTTLRYLYQEHVIGSLIISDFLNSWVIFWQEPVILCIDPNAQLAQSSGAPERQFLPKAGSVHRKSIKVAAKTQRARQRQGKVQKTGSKTPGGVCTRKNAERLRRRAKTSWQREKGARRLYTRRRKGWLDTGETYRGGGDNHNGGKCTKAGREFETRRELEPKMKQETELKQ